MKSRADALDLLIEREYAGKPERLAALAEARLSSRIAGEIYRIRTEAGLTQKELAARVGTDPSVISRLEDSDYHGRSVRMLFRIAAALDKELEIRFNERKPVNAAQPIPSEPEAETGRSAVREPVRSGR